MVFGSRTSTERKMSTGKIALFGGLAALGAGAAYYFLIYRPGNINASTALTNISQAVDAITVKPNQYEGQLLRGGNDVRVYLIKDGYKHWITSPDVLKRLGFTFAQVKSVPVVVLDAIPTSSSLSGFSQKLLI
jgi:hypothetical protein